MTFRIFHKFAITAALVFTALGAEANTSRTLPSWDTWSVDCGNSGICSASTFVRGQSTWADVRVVRDWPAAAEPLLRITTNTPLADDGAIRLIIDGKVEDTLPILQLREIQTTVTPPAGFRPTGGEGFWYPTGQATRTLLEKIVTASTLVLELPIGQETAEVKIDLGGLYPALSWIDARQNRTNTQSAIIVQGQEGSVDAPHADSITSPDQLPPAVRAVWEASGPCADIDPAIFASLDAVSIPLGDKPVLYLLPCGAPGAYNAPYIGVLASPDSVATRIHLARMAEPGPVTTDIIYNATWDPATLQLDGFFKGSGVGECGIWNRWTWTPSGFALIEEAARQSCDGVETPLSEWPTTWPTSAPRP